MRKLFSLGLSDIAWSILPIVFWHLTGLFWGDTYGNGFIIGYSFQFINHLLILIFLTGSLKSGISAQSHENHFGAGFLCYLASLLICIILSLWGSCLLPVFGYRGMAAHGLYTVYVWQFMTDGIGMGLSYGFQYRGMRKQAQVLSWSWLALRLICLMGGRWIYPDHCLKALGLCNLTMLILGLFLMLLHVDFDHMRFDLHLWAGREGCHVTHALLMFVIYLLGVGNMSGDPAFLAAYGISTVCSDIQWDLKSAVDTYTAVEAANGDWEKKKYTIFRQVAGYAFILFLSSLFLVFLSGNRMALAVWSIEMCLYVPDSLGTCLLSYVSVKDPTRWLAVLGIFYTGLRLALQLMIPSLWGVPAACFADCLAFSAGSLLLYQKSRRKSFEIRDNLCYDK